MNRAIALSLSFLLLACVSMSGDTLCDRIGEIRTLPFRGEQVDDDVFNAFLEHGRNAIPCLIVAITDTNPMPDPRKAPKYDDVVVGDVAVFVLLEITGKPIQEMLPAEISAEFSAKGVYAFFRYVQDPKKREIIQGIWKQWWEVHQPTAPGSRRRGR